MKKLVAVTVLAGLVAASILTSWPFDHQFSTHTWPGPFGWLATNTPGNVVAGFVQLGIGFVLGFSAKRLGVMDRAKQWVLKDLHERVAELHDKVDKSHARLDHIIVHHPDIPNLEEP